jgi:hypothetical protein
MTAPAATAFHILNGSNCMKLPTKDQFTLAYKELHNTHLGNMDLAKPLSTNNSKQQTASINNTVVPDQPTPIMKNNNQAMTHMHLQLPATVADFMASLIANEDKFCFICHHIPGLHRYEWRLVQIELSESIQKNPMTLATGRILVTFYIAHLSDIAFNALRACPFKSFLTVKPIYFRADDLKSMVLGPAVLYCFLKTVAKNILPQFPQNRVWKTLSCT